MAALKGTSACPASPAAAKTQLSIPRPAWLLREPCGKVRLRRAHVPAACGPARGATRGDGRQESRMQKLQGIAVSPGVAIGEALVVDQEGFRIPRRFVARDAVEHELDRLDGGHRRRRRRNRAQSPAGLRRAGRSIRRDLLGPSANAPRSAAAERTRRHDPRAALLARVCRQPRAAALCQGLPVARQGLFVRAGQRHLRHRKAPAATTARPAARGTLGARLAGHRAGAQSHAQRNRQSQPRLRPSASSPKSAARAATPPSSPRRWKFRPSSAPARS